MRTRKRVKAAACLLAAAVLTANFSENGATAYAVQPQTKTVKYKRQLSVQILEKRKMAGRQICQGRRQREHLQRCCRITRCMVFWLMERVFLSYRVLQMMPQ